MDSLNEEIPPFEELIQEEELPSLNLKSIIDSVSSLPLIDRLDINQESLCDKEKKLIELQTKKYSDKTTSSIVDKKSETLQDDLSTLESEYSQDECFDPFLKNFYNCKEDDDLLVNIKRNMMFDEAIQEPIDEEKFINEVETYTPSKEFLQFLRYAHDGKHDDLVAYGTLPLQDSSPDISSDEEEEIRQNKVKEWSYKLKFFTSSNSMFLEPIINLSESSTSKIISGSSGKISTVKKEEILLSDSESENYLKQKNLALLVDKINYEPPPHETKKDIKILNKKKEKSNTMEVKNKSSKNIESEVKVMKSKKKETKIFGNLQGSSICSNTPTIEKYKISEDSFINSPPGINNPVNPNQLSKSSENVKRNVYTEQGSNETSSSGEEDWEHLAAKNLIFRSRTLGQKGAKK